MSDGAGERAGDEGGGLASGADPQPDFSDFDQLVASLDRWCGSLRDWGPAAAIHAEWSRVGPRLDRARRELARVLVVGVIGGTGTGKSTLVNALAGADVSEAGDVARPTTTAPVVVAGPDVDVSWLPLDALRARVVRSDAPAVANIVLVDCPDPDTQPREERPSTGAPERPVEERSRPSADNRNRDLLEQVLPACDVLLVVATAQKYKSWIVAREVAAFAPGRPLFFVQTQASRDADIRADWRRELESQGFRVPRIFRLDGVEAGRRAAAGLAPEPGFAELVTAIDEELAGRAARRVRRTGAIDLAAWFVRESRDRLTPLGEPVHEFVEGITTQRTRLEGLLAAAVGGKLRSQRHGWQRLVASEVVERWQGGPFATFVHAVDAVSSLWGRSRLGGGLVGRLLAGGRADAKPDGSPGWLAVEEIGLSESEVEQSRSILAGLAARARIGDPLVGRARLDDSQVQSLAVTLLDRAGRWLGTGVERMVDDRRGRLGSAAVHWTFEVLFAALLVAVLARAGWGFFYGHLWLGRPAEGAGFLQQAFVWLLLWGLALRWAVFRLVRLGLERDIAGLVRGVPAARLVDPLLADYSEAGRRVTDYLAEGRRLDHMTTRLAERLDEPTAALGRLRPPTSGTAP